MYVRELHARYRLRRIKGPPLSEEPLTTPRSAAQLFSTLFRDEVVEVSGLLCLSTKQRVLAYHELARGTLNHVLMQPRDVFKAALLSNALTVILGHNHPSGDVTPSPEDRAVTRQIANAGEVMGIELADHIIVSADSKYSSFKEMGLL